jgi:hypothetical protein
MIKKLKLAINLTLILSILTLSTLILPSPMPVSAQSTCPELSSNFGTARYTLNEVVSGSHRLWLRLKSTDGVATLNYSLSGGGVSCNQSVNTSGATNWTWIRSATAFSTTGGTVSLQIAGTKAGVGVDCFVLTSDTSFTPTTSVDCQGPQIPTPPPPPPPPAPDTTPPQVSLTAPANNATVSGTVTVSANASDNVGVTRVSYFLDGSSTAFSNDTSSPYTSTWTSTTVANGNHTIRATATDAAGNVATSQIITINVQNTVADTTKPTTAITSPANNTTAIGIVTINATATDNIGVTKLELLIDGTLAATDTTSPYIYSINTTTLSEGNHTLTTRAYDAANNQQLSNPITINVDNIPPAPLLCTDTTANNQGQPLPCTYTTPPPVTPPTKPGDTNNSGSVDRTDLRTVLFFYGTNVATNTSGDLNGDGKVDRNDLRIVLFYYGT